MRLTFLGKASESGESPTLFATDRDSYIVQGYIVTDAATLSSLQVPDGHAVVEVYARLLDFLAEDGVPGAVTRRVAPIVGVTPRGTYLIQGVRLADDDPARHRLALPDHEDAVEVPKAALVALLEAVACG